MEIKRIDGTRMDHWVMFGMLARAANYHRQPDFKEGVRRHVGPRTRKWVNQGISAIEATADMASEQVTPIKTVRDESAPAWAQDPYWPFPPSPLPKPHRAPGRGDQG